MKTAILLCLGLGVSLDAHATGNCTALQQTVTQLLATIKTDTAALTNCQNHPGSCTPGVIAGLQKALVAAQTNLQNLRVQINGCAGGTTPHTLPLVEYEYVSAIGTDHATVNFITPNAPISAQVSYLAPWVVELTSPPDAPTKVHAVVLTKLHPGVTYQYQIIIGGGAAYAGTFQTLAPPVKIVTTSPLFQSPLNHSGQPLRGYVDMHAHLMRSPRLRRASPVRRAGRVHLDAGGDHPDGQRHLQRERSSLDEHRGVDRRLLYTAHGGHDFNNNKCGDEIRHLFLSKFAVGNGAQDLSSIADAFGFPGFPNWPRSNDILHQQMWIEWIRRAHDGGLRVMLADAGNSTIAAKGSMGNTPNDDKSIVDKEISQMKVLATRNASFMEIAYSSADLRRIVGQDKLAIIIGAEVDDPGSFVFSHQTPAASAVTAEIKRLYAEGVRHIFPVHITDNYFGGTAIYVSDFWRANKWQWGQFWDLICAQPQDFVTFVPTAGVDLVQDAFLGIVGVQPIPSCPAGIGVVNRRGLQNLGKTAITTMMQLGMLIDIDHMSQQTANDTIAFTANTAGGAYPLLSSHNGMRQPNGMNDEKSRTSAQYQELARRGGIVGIGSGGSTPEIWSAAVRQVMALGLPFAFGSDVNGFVPLPGPGACSAASPCVTYSSPQFPQLSSYGKTWNFNTDGVANFGLFPDFLRAVEFHGGKDIVNKLFDGAEAVAKTWEKVEAVAAKIP